MTESELYHYGVLGMRWGVRKDRSRGSGRKAGYRVKTENMSEDAKVASQLKTKHVKEMSNAELRKLNDRLQLEQNYSRLNPSKVAKGLQYATVALTALKTGMEIYNNGEKLVKIGKKVANRVLRK